MKLRHEPTAQPSFVYREPPVSGNTINGLGEKEPRRARYVFHSNSKTGPLPWDRLQAFFRYTYPARMLPRMLSNMWASFRPQGKIAPKRTAVDDPARMTRQIKREAQRLGAGIVGVCEMKDEFLIEGKRQPYRYAISLGLSMDRDAMLEAPRVRAGWEVLNCYNRCSLLTVDLARYIRSLGWPARGLPVNSSSECLHIPIAIEAGLGQLGKHGSLICKEYGSNVRLTTVLTDLPLALDTPIDIGVDDLCQGCRICVEKCPPGAIFETKQWVRGQQKWYVDFDRCVPYFCDNYGCAICLEVCPWSEPGRGERLSERLLEVRERRKDAKNRKH